MTMTVMFFKPFNVDMVLLYASLIAGMVLVEGKLVCKGETEYNFHVYKQKGICLYLYGEKQGQKAECA